VKKNRSVGVAESDRMGGIEVRGKYRSADDVNCLKVVLP
jgi:hypothetical protein